MKKLLPLLLFIGGPLAGLAANVTPSNDSPRFTWIDPADPAAADIRQMGDQFTSRVENLLIFEVERGLSEYSLAKALEMMHLKDLTLPKPRAGQPTVTAVKRTSLSLRDPANQPDAADRAALERIDTAIRDGVVVPMVLIQRLDPADAPVEWRVYRAVTTTQQCLMCHGPRESLQPEVRDFLDQHYPKDKATGYTAYKWRGVIRVSLTTAEPKAPVKTE